MKLLGAAAWVWGVAAVGLRKEGVAAVGLTALPRQFQSPILEGPNKIGIRVPVQKQYRL